MEDPKVSDMLNSKVSKKLMLLLKLMDKVLMKENSKLISALKDLTKKKKVPPKKDPSENNLVEKEEIIIIIEEENNQVKNHKKEKEIKNLELKSPEKNPLPYLLET